MRLIPAVFDEWIKFKKRYCVSCVNKVFCLINENQDNFKAQPKRKSDGKIVCVNFKTRYLGNINSQI